jgi:Uma2 family endonuclease
VRDLLNAAAGDKGVVDLEIGFRGRPEHEYRVADVAFVSQERWEHISPDGNLAGAPEIVIEVLSPSNSAAEMLDKEQLCLENGSVEFWVVDPRGHQVKVSTTDDRTITYKSGHHIPLLFGGHIAVDEIFG